MPAIIVSERVSHFSNGGSLILEWGSSCALYIIFNYQFNSKGFVSVKVSRTMLPKYQSTICPNISSHAQIKVRYMYAHSYTLTYTAGKKDEYPYTV